MAEVAEEAASMEASITTPSALRRVEIALMGLLSAGLLLATALRWWPLSMLEALGFATGGACVWLCVREHIWNWPLGLANNLLFFALFWHSRLFADMGLQVVYFAFGMYGWWNWLHADGWDGRAGRRGALPISRAPIREWLAIAALAPFAIWGLWLLLVRVQGASPFWDATTTVLSLVAQYLLCRKRLENWIVWIVVDAVYVPLYLSRDLHLTALLYAVFLVMCIYGLRAWLRKGAPARAEE